MNFFIFIIFTLAKPLLAVAGTLFKVYSVLGELLAQISLHFISEAKYQQKSASNRSLCLETDAVSQKFVIVQ